ncbi:MAG: glycosyltransferase, partial [Burkholderiaceae bacterium]
DRLPIHFTGHLHDSLSLPELCSDADAFLLPSSQDNLPSAAVEAQACGTPVLAYGEGGALEILNTEAGSATGMFFHTLEPEVLAEAICEFEAQSFNAKDCQANALRFSGETFDDGVRTTLKALGYS